MKNVIHPRRIGFLIILFFAVAVHSLSAQFTGSQNTITSDEGAARSVITADLDSDGDQDVLSASGSNITWFQNDGSGNFSSPKTITENAEEAWSVFTADLDGDNDQDVLSASSGDGKIAWYENEGNGSFGSQQVVTTSATGARSVFAADLDGDDDQDVIFASESDNKIAWYQNDGNGNFSTENIITTNTEGAWSVYATDLDGDDDEDVLSASAYDHKIAWYENDGSGSFGSQIIISTNLDTPFSVHATDLDEDGDQDVLSASRIDNKIAWYENEGSGTFGSQQVISTQAAGATSVFTANLDGDEDKDVLSASWHDDKIAWYENDGSENFGQQQVITTNTDDPWSVYTADLEGDGDQDVLSASMIDNKIAWYENKTIDTTPPAAPANLASVFSTVAIQLTWTSPQDDDIAKYRIYRDVTTIDSLSGPSESILYDSVEAAKTSFPDSSVSVNNSYHYRVTAVDSAGNESGFSAQTSRNISELQMGLLAYYPFTENAADSSGHGNDGQVNGPTSATDRFENIDHAYWFDGIDDYIEIPDTNTNKLNRTSFTISAWIQKSSFDGANNPIVSKGNDNNYDLQYRVQLTNNSEIAFSTQSTNWHSVNWTGLSFETSRWHHIIVTYDQDSEQLELFIDGESQGTKGFNNSYFPSTNSPMIMGHYDGGNNNDFFQGIIDDVRIYNEVVSESKIDQIYTEGGYTPPEPGVTDDEVAYYPFTSNPGDSSGNAYHGTVNGATLTTDRFGNTQAAYSFNGSDAYIDLPDDAVPTSQGSVSMWFSVDSVGMGNAQLFSMSDFSAPDGTRLAAFVTDSRKTGVAFLGDTLGTRYVNISRWNHMQFAWDGSESRFYLNGKLVATGPGGTPTNGRVNVGSYAEGESGHFAGSIDEVRIYDHKLTQTEAQSFYLAGSTPPARPTGLTSLDPIDHAELQWNASTDPNLAGYNLYRSGKSGTGFGDQLVNDSLITSTSYLDTTAQKDSTYYYRITAVNQAGVESPLSDELEVTTEVSFTEVQTNITNLYAGASAFGDYDGDGNLDILLTGEDSSGNFVTKLYQNSGEGSFSEINAGLMDVVSGSAEWGDYDGDGDVDLLLTGENNTGNFITKVYRNEGNGIFVDIQAGIIGIRTGDAKWGDYDNDGDLDIILAGYDGSSSRTEVYRNEGNDEFENMPTNLPGIAGASVSLGDYDLDNDLDILLEGNAGSSFISRIYRNDGNNNFKNIQAGLPGVAGGSVKWSDFDNDGDLDVIIAGDDQGNRITSFYRNDNGNFIQVSNNILGVGSGVSITISDYNNDGSSDLFLSGRDSTGTNRSLIYRNNGEGAFNDIEADLTGLQSGAAHWGDIDNDNDQDLLVIGRDDSDRIVTKVYRNNSNLANSDPDVPSSPLSAVTDTTATFNWQPATDPETPTSGLNYNITIGTASGQQDVAPAHANLATGKRTIAARGMVQDTSWTIRDLTPGREYVWRVQAVDAGLAGGEFSQAQQFYYEGPQLSPLAAGLDSLSDGDVALADYDGDGDQDLAISGLDDQSSPQTKIYTNQDGTFNDLQAGLEGLSNGGLTWSDYDRDGDQDLLVIGDNGTEVVTHLYANSNGNFSTSVFDTTGIVNGEVSFVDFNNDGTPDIAMTGDSAGTGTYRTLLYRNTTQGFELHSTELPGLNNSSMAWGDYNNDGYKDLALSGTDGSSRTAQIFTNNGDGTFTDIGAGLTGFSNGALAWEDYDGDGDLDLTISGDDGSQLQTIIYENDEGTFTNAGATLAGLSDGDLVWGDFDNDRDQDLVLSGSNGSSPATLYYSNENGTLTESSLSLTGLQQTALAAADLDGDNDLDLVTAGTTGSQPVTALYRNNEGTENGLPAAPQNLRITSVSDTTATLRWDRSTDPETPSAGLSYALRVGSASGLADIIPVRTVKDTALTITGLTPGTTYHWSVQAVDGARAAGSAATEQTFETTNELLYTDIGATLTGLSNSASAWGDFDNDGDVDLAVIGEDQNSTPQTYLYENDNGSFSELQAGLLDLSNGTVSWSDVNADGHIDLLLTGDDGSGAVAQLYLNNGDGTFMQASAGITGITGGSADWADYDLDGDYDLLLTGAGSSGPVTGLYRNNGDTTFTEIQAGLPDVQDGHATWGDFNSNGAPDILITGYDGSARIAHIYQNNGEDGFADISAGLTGLRHSTVSWGDINNDGDLDALLAGESDAGPASLLYRNEGSGNFAESSVSLVGLQNAASTVADIDNDGLPDIVLNGSDGSNAVTTVYRNESDGSGTSFTEMSAGLPGIENGAISWADIDGDHDLDLYLGGSGQSAIYRSDVGLANEPPSPPRFLKTEAINDTTIKLSWDPATDSRTPGEALGYHVRIGTGPDMDDIRPAEADINSGIRRIQKPGTVRDTSLTITGLNPVQNYYWSVQSADPAYAGSRFATVQSFNTTGGVPFTDVMAELTGGDNGSVTWGDFDNDGDLDLVLTGTDGDTPFIQIYRNNGDRTFTPVTTDNLIGVQRGEADWGDFDNDGDLDLVLTGRSADSPQNTKIYRNNGDGTFTDIQAGITDLENSAADWGDYNNDGDLDLAVMGYNGSDYSTIIYRNNGDSTFTDISAGLSELAYGSLDWGDYNNDGYADLLVTGATVGSERQTRIYRNNGSGNFAAVDAALPGVQNSSAEWGDLDNDGALDILLSGYTGSETISQVYRNEGEGQFTKLETGLTGLRYAAAAWGDYNNDGLMDILLSGNSQASGSSSADFRTLLYQNQGDGTFAPDENTGLPVLNRSSAAWGDYDNDGDLDMVLAGNNGTQGITKVLQNDNLEPNTPPEPPTTVQARADVTRATLSWSGASDNETDAEGLTYSIKVGTAPGKGDILSGQADPDNGNRRIAGVGSITDTTYTVTGLQPDSTYYWSVQAVDAGFAGSEFTESRSFTTKPKVTFAEVSTSIPSLSNGSSSWGDYDNDGDLDLFISGYDGSERRAMIYRQNDDGTFTDISAALIGVDQSASAWGDYDNDGDLDILYSGNAGGSNITKLYRNTGDDSFEDVSVNMEGIRDGTVDWGDYNNDGRLDVLLAGYRGSGCCNDGFIGVYTNTEEGFVRLSSELDVREDFDNEATGFWGDYNNDGNLDILIATDDNSYILKNNGDETFTDINANLPDFISSPFAKWLDYNSDGDQDVLFLERNSTRLYVNEGDDQFVNSEISLPENNEYASIVDYDNDGDEDILFNSSGMYRNNGDGSFSNAQLELPYFNTAVWGDFDNDNDLDLLADNELYQNQYSISNTPPTAPATLQASASFSEATVSWDPATDNETPSEALYYNVYIGTSSGSDDLLPAQAELSNGFRRVARMGQVTDTTLTVTDLDPGQTYHWSVQAVDVGFKGSSFAGERTFTTSSFTDIKAGLASVTQTAFDWGDYDNDGDLDLLLTGNNGSGQVATIYQNDGQGGFSAIDAGLTGLENGSVDWGDYDADGDLDILLTGSDGASPQSIIYRNDGSGSFSDIQAGLTGVQNGSAKWGDYDNDGDLDLVLTGNDGSGPVSTLYQNEGGNTFTPVDAGITAVTNSSIDWADYDNDGDLDITIAGNTGSSRITQLFRNNGDNTFTEEFDSRFEGIDEGSVAWGNFNSDRNLALLVSGNNGNEQVTQIYGMDTEADTTGIVARLSGVGKGSVSWADYNNDGRSDLLISGQDTSGTRTLKVYQNEGGRGDFKEINIGLPGIDQGMAGWADFDNDGDLDIMLAGNDGSVGIAKIYENDTETKNEDPAAPANLQATAADSTITLRWDPADDDETATGALNYNVYVGTSPGSDDVAPAQADLSDGFRRVTDMGQVADTSLTVTGLDPSTTYHWSVQAVDGGLKGGEFASEESIKTKLSFTAIDAGLAGVENASADWGDYDNDGDLDLVISGYSSVDNNITRIYQNNGDGSFTDIQAGLPGIEYGTAKWGDYDADGGLDLLLAGDYTSHIFRNDGDGQFTDLEANLATSFRTAGDWRDYDSDGDLDLLLAGDDQTRLYQNQGDTVFTAIDAGLEGVSQGAVSWGDYDGDGDPDILLAGEDESNNPLSRIYRNDGNGVFTGISADIHGMERPMVSWADYDNDGDLDVLVAGYDGTDDIAKLYRNEGEDTFTDTQAGLSGYSNGDISWGDYDNDGDLDLLIKAEHDSAYVYRNNGNDNFSVEERFRGTNSSALVWGDYDNDGDLDILLAGLSNNMESGLTQIYQNSNDISNTAPSAPTNLAAVAENDTTITVRWNRATDSETPSKGLNYNVYIGTGPGQQNVVPAHADLSNGFRRIARLGQVQDTSLTVTGLETDSTYHWSVQAIDAGLKGGGWGEEQSFTFQVSASEHYELLSNSGIDSLANSGAAWGDYNNDGDLDLALSGTDDQGQTATRLYQNNGDNTFTEADAQLTAVRNGDMHWADIENDGDLDLIVAGQSRADTAFTDIFRNEGGGQFGAMRAGLTDLQGSTIASGDLNSDGTIDLVVVGRDDSDNDQTAVYLNQGDGTFNELETDLPGVSSGGGKDIIDLGDYDGDGDPDLLITGSSTSAIYRNDNLSFTDISAGLDPASNSTARWVDYDADGDLDAAVAGSNSSGDPVIQIFANEGDDSFNEDTETGLQPFAEGDMVWADADNDGDIDVVTSGTTGDGPSTVLYKNNGDGTFSDFGFGFEAFSEATVELAHINQFPGLDLLISGTLNGAPVTKLFSSNDPRSNSAPTSPQNLAAEVSADSVMLSWEAPSDEQSPSEALSYNLRVGTSAGAADVVNANNISGQRILKTTGFGNKYKSTETVLKNLKNRTYYWSVQAVDPGMYAGEFATERSFEVTGVPSKYALSFDGTDDYINFGSVSDVVSDSSLTLSSWIKPSALSGSDQILLGKAGNMEWGISSGNLVFRKWTDGTQSSVAGNTKLQSGEWYHVAVTYNFQSSTVTLYLDGNTEAQTTMQGRLDIDNSDLLAGSRNGNEGFFSGSIYNLKIWNRSRSQFMLNRDIHRVFSGSVDGLTGYWSFAEGVSDTTADLTQSGHTGTLMNGTAWSTDLPNRIEDYQPPATPTGLTTEGIESEVNISWDPNSEADLQGYRLYRRRSTSPDYVQIQFLDEGTSSYTGTDLTNGATYFYAVAAVDTLLNQSALPQAQTVPILDQYTEAEPNNDPANADSVGINTRASGEVTDENSVDYYRFAAEAEDFIEFSLATTNIDARLELFDESDNKLDGVNLAQSATGKFYYAFADAGTYYLKVTYLSSTVSSSRASSSIPINKAKISTAGVGEEESDSQNTGAYTLNLFYSSPVVPEIQQSGSNLDNLASLEWNNTQADSFNVYRSTQELSNYTMIGGIDNLTYYVDTGLQNEQLYYYRIASVYEDNGTESELSQPISVTPDSGVYDMELPYALSNITVDGTINTEEWKDAISRKTEVQPGDSVTVYLQNDSDSLYVAYQDVDADVSAHNQFILHMDRDADGTLENGDGVFIYQNDPASPSSSNYGLQFVEASGSFPDVAFNPQDAISPTAVEVAHGTGSNTGMVVEMAFSLPDSEINSDIGDTIATALLTSDGQVIRGKYSGSTYHDAPSTYIPTILSDGPVPTPPQNLIATPRSNEVTLRWNQSPDKEEVDSYRIFRSTDNNSFSRLTTTSDTARTITGLTNNEPYYYYVIAGNSFGKQSLPSDTLSIVPGDNGPILMDTAPTTNQLIAVDSTITLNFDQPIKETSVANGIELQDISSSETIEFEVSFSDGHRNVMLHPQSMKAADTLQMTIRGGASGNALLNEEDIGFDGNANNLLDSGAQDDSTMTYRTTFLGDYDLNGIVDMEDLIKLSSYWHEDDYSHELGPVTGSFPQLIVEPDEEFNIEDLITFIRYWNLSITTNGLNDDADGSDAFITDASSMKQTPEEPTENDSKQINISDINTDAKLGDKNIKPTADRAGQIPQSKSKSMQESSESVNLTHLSLEPTRMPDKYEDAKSEVQSTKHIEYELNVDYPDSMLAAEVLIEYDPSAVQLKYIRDSKMFDEHGGRTIFLSRIDSANGRAIVNAVNFGELGEVEDEPLATLQFELQQRDVGEFSIGYDIRDSKNKSSTAYSTIQPEGSIEMPDEFVLEQNYPNPFNPQTTIQYQISEPSRVQLLVYDVIGRKVATLVNRRVDAGYYRLQWNAAKHLASGMYLYVLDVESNSGREFREVRKMLLIK